MAGASVPDSAAHALDGTDQSMLYSFDASTVGTPAVGVGSNRLFTFTTVGNVGTLPLTITGVSFPEVTDGLVVVDVVFQREDQPEIVGGSVETVPSTAAKVGRGLVLPAVVPPVSDVFEDPRFWTVLVEVQLIAPGKWSVGPMDIEFEYGGERYVKRVAIDVGDMCTTPTNDPCVPGLEMD